MFGSYFQEIALINSHLPSQTRKLRYKIEPLKKKKNLTDFPIWLKSIRNHTLPNKELN
jgi:hypothetical protein